MMIENEKWNMASNDHHPAASIQHPENDKY
jgi:hypothetical protein